MKITCNNCFKSITLKPETVKKRAGQTVSYKCKNCNEMIRGIKFPALRSTRNTTQIVEPDKGLKLQLKESEYHKAQILHLQAGMNYIGRIPQTESNEHTACPIKTKDPYMSRTHCCIEYDEHSNSYILSDAGSKNGTFLNGKKLLASQKLFLEQGSIVRIGFTEIIFSKEDSK